MEGNTKRGKEEQLNSRRSQGIDSKECFNSWAYPDRDREHDKYWKAPRLKLKLSIQRFIQKIPEDLLDDNEINLANKRNKERNSRIRNESAFFGWQRLQRKHQKTGDSFRRAEEINEPGSKKKMIKIA